MFHREQSAFMDECFAYDDLLQKNGHIVGGEALRSSQNAVTQRWQDGTVSITDGPYAKTKKQLGALVFALSDHYNLKSYTTDLNQAIQLMSKHPAAKGGSIEIRPVDNLSEMIRESERRRLTITNP